MNIALVFAGGTGIRMSSKAKPKQFLEFQGKAIIIHTLEAFERHPEIDAICVVCLQPWLKYLEGLLERFRIQKARWVVPGGATSQESVFNGLEAIHRDLSARGEDTAKTVVLVHDGVRPMIAPELLSENISSVAEYGSAITVSPSSETIICLEQNDMAAATVDRNVCVHAKAPQSFWLEDIFDLHKRARQEGLTGMIDAASLALRYGKKLHVVYGSPENIKITTPADFFMFRAIYESRESSEVFGI